VLEVLGDFPSATPPLPWLLTVVPRLQPRYFSISSSPLAHPRTVHLTVAVVAWTVRARPLPVAAL
jgi:nitric-oxide synthase